MTIAQRKRLLAQLAKARAGRWPPGYVKKPRKPRSKYVGKATAQALAERTLPAVIETKDAGFDFKRYCAEHGAGADGTVLLLVRTTAEFVAAWRDVKGIARRRRGLITSPPSSRSA